MVAVSSKIDYSTRPYIAQVQARRFSEKYVSDLVSFDRHQLSDFATYVQEDIVIGHDIEPLPALLSQSGVNLRSIWVEAREMSSILFPAGQDDSLQELAGRLRIETIDLASDGPKFVAHVFQALVSLAKTLPVGTLRRIEDLCGKAGNELIEIFSGIIAEMHEAPIEPATASDSGRSGFPSRERRNDLISATQNRRLDQEEIRSLLSPGGPLAARFPGFETRAEQVEMALAVARALDDKEGGPGRQLLVEGGTGIGKSVAYLLPAILFAARNNVRVVVSTNTINLQEQLIAKDVPDLLKTLGDAGIIDSEQFAYTQLKGRSNYVCLKRWESAAANDNITPEDANTLLKTLIWLRSTRTGDRSELNFQGRELAGFERISASGFNQCLGSQSGACFYRNAREAAASAHVVVVNHALLLSDLRVGGGVIPDYDYLVVDEAHNLETEATRQLGFRVTEGVFDELGDRLDRLMQILDQSFGHSGIANSSTASLRTRLDEIRVSLHDARIAWAKLNGDLREFADQIDDRSQGDPEFRITDAKRAQPSWSKCEIAWDEFDRTADGVTHQLHSLIDTISQISPNQTRNLSEITSELTGWGTELIELRSRFAEFVVNSRQDIVYWLTKGQRFAINGAPLEVGSILQEQLFSSKRAVILTSATLAINGEFEHIKSRLQLEAPEELTLGSPFDYKNSALLCLPSGLPEPNSENYAHEMAMVLSDIARHTRGRTMALFTSYSAIHATADRLRTLLHGSGIGVLAQGSDGTPGQILKRFQDNPVAVLLGTNSFWEGIDVGNQALKVLVLARLPFNVPNEPVFAARSELYENAFRDYALPLAVLRFRQGFGRLIRGMEDTGVVVMLDSRITSKSYGGRFLSAAPDPTIIKAPVADVLKEIRNWLADRGDS